MRRSKPIHLATVLASLGFGGALLVGLMFFGGFWTLGRSYSVSALVPDARGLAGNASVMIAGLQAGKVTAITRNGPNAILTLRIDRGPIPLAENSRVAVRLRSLAGESYVQLYPGTSTVKVRSGGSLGLSQSDDFTDVDQILQSLTGHTETAARQTVQGLGTAVAGEGTNLNQVLGNAAAVISDSVPLTSTLAAQHGQVADLVSNLGNVMAAISQRRAAVREFAAGARTAFTAIAARDRSLRETLDQLPYLLGSLRVASRTVAQVSPHIRPVVNQLAGALIDASPAVHLLTPASASGIKLLRSLDAVARPLRGVLGNLERLQGPATDALPKVHAFLCQTAPVLKYAAPYGPDLSSLFENFGSAASAYDGTGHAARTAEVVTPSAAAQTLPPQVSDAVNGLVQLGLAQTHGIEGYDPFPPPGDADDQISKRGLGADGPAEAGKTLTYPHVVAAC